MNEILTTMADCQQQLSQLTFFHIQTEVLDHIYTPTVLVFIVKRLRVNVWKQYIIVQIIDSEICQSKHTTIYKVVMVLLLSNFFSGYVEYSCSLSWL